MKRTFNVKVIGLSDREFTVLKSIERISTTRVRGYTFAETQDQCDIYLVDGNNADALEEWGRCRSRCPAPAITLSNEGQALFGERGFRRPLIVSKLIHILDEITTHELRFLPELTIGHELVLDPTKIKIQPSDDQRHLALVVDDSAIIRKQIELGLKLAGCTVDTAETAEAATSLLATKSYDIIFLDVVLPGADGYQLCKSIKRDRTKKGTPVIMLTGKNSPLDHVKGSLAGCDTYLTKPVENAVFQDVIKKYLKRPLDARDPAKAMTRS